jgi:hypothetical protein
MRVLLVPALLVFAAMSAMADKQQPLRYEFGGDIRSRVSLQTFPDNSIIEQFTGPSATDLSSILRLKFAAGKGPWDFQAAGQLFYLYGETTEYSRELAAQAPELAALFGRLPNDDRRWWDLTHTIKDTGKTAIIDRFDRLSVGYTSDKVALRFGRQALSWGNGLFFVPMDIVNPFDPAAVDTEYKAGDDMLYGQYLQNNGNDIQATYVVRRNPLTGNVESDQSTMAAKYHGFWGASEYDVLFARQYGEGLLGVGGGRDVGGAVWRADLVLSDTETEGVVTQFVLNTSYSWVWRGKNLSGSLEYYFNGFGQSGGCYSPACLAQNPELLARISRGQLFTLGRNYLAGSLLVEVTPLFTVTPNVFWNLGDSSALLQLVTQNSLGDNLLLLGAIGIPVGASGTEYGGIETGLPNTYYSSNLSAFLQLNWYF